MGQECPTLLSTTKAYRSTVSNSYSFIDGAFCFLRCALTKKRESTLVSFFHLFIYLFSVLREQWIRAKYERKEFIDGAPQPNYLTGRILSTSQQRPHWGRINCPLQRGGRCREVSVRIFISVWVDRHTVETTSPGCFIELAVIERWPGHQWRFDCSFIIL